jgi:hypothetical protein
MVIFHSYVKLPEGKDVYIDVENTNGFPENDLRFSWWVFLPNTGGHPKQQRPQPGCPAANHGKSHEMPRVSGNQNIQ